MSRRTWLAVLSLALACVDEAATSPASTRDAKYFLARLHRLDELPRLEPGTAELASTWDRAGGNWLDGMTYPDVDGDTNVLLDVDGPGCIHRISTGVLADELVDHGFLALDATFELWLDGERALALPAAQLFDPVASPFASPLVYEAPYATVRMPIPFAEHAKIQLVSPSQSWGVFWQIGYSRYPDTTAVETLRLPLDEATRRALDETGEAWLDAVAGVRAPPGEAERITAELGPDERVAWTDAGCGTITQLQLAVDPNWSASWRELEVEIHWDDAEQPAVAMPAHRLFVGSDYGDDPTAAFDSLALGAEDGRAWLRLPMPYREAARVELHNTGEFPIDVELAVVRDRCATQPDDYGYFHATLAAAPAATPDSPTAGPLGVPVHRLFEHRGRGKVVGTGLRLDWPHADLWWGEGDWQIWVDRELNAWPPSYHGTGTEEFYDGGWTVFGRRALAGAVKQRPGLVTVYGFHPTDPFNFEDQIRVQVETLGLGEGHSVIDLTNPEWVTTTYWYSEDPD